MKNILIVDDERKIREVYTSFFESRGFCVSAVPDVVQACSILTKSPVELILLDINLGEDSGRIIYEAVKSFFPRIKIVVSSVYSIDEQRVLMPEADHYYDKSEGINVLLERVNDLLDKQPCLQ